MTNTTTSALRTDEYCFTMAQSFFRHEQNEEVTFEMFVRKLPADYGYAVFAGLENLLDYLDGLHFDENELQFMARQLQDPAHPEHGPLYDKVFLNYLKTFKFTGQVYAMREGSIFFSGEPIIRVVAPRIQATIIEPMLLKLINRQSAVATKAARITDAAQGRPIWDFSLRRDPGDPLETSRAAHIGGFVGAAVPEAGYVLGMPTSGTMAHQYIQMFGENGEQRGFEQWLQDYPGRAVLLVDTYDTRRGIERAIAASEKTGVPIKAVRIDSGDLLADTIWARQTLDDAGMYETMVMPTGDVDEYTLTDLLAQGAAIDLSAAGTRVANAPHFGGVYKITSQKVEDKARHFVMKKAIGKVSDPGSHQVWRSRDRDIIAMEDELIGNATAMLERVYAAGGRLGIQDDLTTLAARVRQNVLALPEGVRAVRNPEAWPVERSQGLLDLRAELGDETLLNGETK